MATFTVIDDDVGGIFGMGDVILGSSVSDVILNNDIVMEAREGDIIINGKEIILQIDGKEIKVSEIVEMKEHYDGMKERNKELEKIINGMNEKIMMMWNAPGMPGMLEAKTEFISNQKQQ